MINKVIVNNFKKFERLEFELTDHVVIAGSNNSGKTTLLQAIAIWSEIALQWTSNTPDLTREEDENYSSKNFNVLRLNSMPLVDFDHLWTSKNIQDPVSIWLSTDQWDIGFELLYKEQELAAIRPMKSVNEKNIVKYIQNPFTSIYIPPLSGLNINEPFFDEIVIPARLARAQGGSVLRNLLLAVSQDAIKWKKLQDIIRSFFGYELDHPTPAPEIRAHYRHSPQGSFYDLSSAASGFLQVLLVYAALLYKESSVVLIDEPDAHLHILLQDKMYQNLREYARQNKSQLIISTHSERLINISNEDNLRLLSNDLLKINDRRKLSDTLHLENMDILLGMTEPGILYVEGSTDIPILREWARILDHPILSFLEKPFSWQTAEHEWPAVRHFSAMRLPTPDFCGVELCDSNDKDHSKAPSPPEGMIRLYWKRYEIESYLIHPETIVRFVKNMEGKKAAEKAIKYMDMQLPPALHKNPFELSDYFQETKGKSLLDRIFNAAGLNINQSDYFQVAAQMKKEEINPEIIQKLDAIAEHLSIG